MVVQALVAEADCVVGGIFKVLLDYLAKVKWLDHIAVWVSSRTRTKTEELIFGLQITNLIQEQIRERCWRPTSHTVKYDKAMKSIKLLHFMSNCFEKSFPIATVTPVMLKFGPELRNWANIVLVDVRDASEIVHRIIWSINSTTYYFPTLSLSE